LDNAIKFTKPTGKVHLVVQKDATNNSLVTVTVSDTGIGIPPERVKEIFEPFHQLDGSATRRYGGTGLGLALVREIIKAHVSLINVQSDVGKGTTISFPLLISKVE
jgi:signal transduction histidine kinase